uniref:Uncharacterized protein n=1 Tax=Arundo donax TaxID=35708 RepID=A0A0A9B4W1_ARUDO
MGAAVGWLAKRGEEYNPRTTVPFGRRRATR